MPSSRPKTSPEQQEQPPGPLPRPTLIEMVGIGGAGKSTLFKALNCENQKIQKLEPPNKLRYLPAILMVVFHWLPIYLWKYRCRRWFTWEEIRNILYLDTWLGYVRAQARARDLIVVLDPGSIYWLSSLKEFGPDFTTHPVFRRWWDARLSQWASALNLIIWIEAPNQLLLERVLDREELHEAKSQPPALALEYFERYRVSYSKMVPEVARRGHAHLFHYRSDQVSTGQMAEEIFGAVDLRSA